VADEILSQYQHVIESFKLITGDKGVFIFTVDGDILFSKKVAGRHVDPGEILKLFQKHIGPGVEPYPQEL